MRTPSRPTFRRRRTPASGRILIARTERALGGYVAACASGEGQALSRVTTNDLHIEYTLGEPGTYLTVDGSNAPAGCAAMVGLNTRTSNVWIFPTNSVGGVRPVRRAGGGGCTVPEAARPRGNAR